MLEFLKSLPISAESWDCYVNHYRGYAWGELADEVHEEAQKSYVALGWTAAMWDRDDAPEEEGKYWVELTDAQRQAAAGVCHTQETWDEVAIPLWSKDDGEGGVEGEQNADDLYSVEETKVAEEKQDIYEQMYSSNDKGMAFNGPTSAHNHRGIAVPFFRYDPWDLLDPYLKPIARAAEYDTKSWNALGTNKLELMDWEMIGAKHHSVQKALQHLGFTEEQWDCYMLHYRTYDWRELKEAGVQQYYKDLGYSYETWEHEEDPDSYGMYWPDLTAAQREAAYQLGYFREVWDGTSLQFWPRTTSNSAGLKDYVKQHRAAVGGGASALLLGLILVCACGFRIIAKRKKTTGITREVEMYGGKRFTDYNDDPAIAGVTRVRSNSGSEVDGCDEDDQHDAKLIVSIV